jgi:translation initiation factor IF-2
MSDTKNSSDKTLSVTPKKTLGLKRGNIERDVVRQSFSHGRTNTVQVERKKRRPLSGDGKSEAPAAAPTARQTAEAALQSATTRPSTPEQAANARAAGLVLRQLSSDELDARARALADAKVHEAEERRHAEEVAGRRAEEQKRLAREREEADRRKSDEDARRKFEETQRERAEETARRRFGGEEPRRPSETVEAPPRPGAAGKAVREVEDDDERPSGLRGRVKTKAPAEPKPVSAAPTIAAAASSPSSTPLTTASASARSPRSSVAVNASACAPSSRGRAKRSCARLSFRRRSPSRNSPTACPSAASTSSSS